MYENLLAIAEQTAAPESTVDASPRCPRRSASAASRSWQFFS